MNTIIFVLAIVGATICHPSGEDGRGGKGGKVGPGGRGPPLPPPPPFLENVSEEAREEFFAIVSNEDETITEQKKDVLIWAQKYGIEAQAQEFNTNMTKLKDELKKNVTELISALPAALEKISAVMENKDQTRLEMREAIKALKAENPKVYRVLRFALRQFGPRRGCFQGRSKESRVGVPTEGPEPENLFDDFQGIGNGVGFPGND